MPALLRPSAALLALLIALAPAAHAQLADSDGDGIPNVRELTGYVFNITTGEIDTCNPAADSPCFVTDPLSWSSDGDPYSDFQEASGVNMDATVAEPYNSPLVAAYPVIEVALRQTSFTANATITDGSGGAITQGSSITNSVESTASASVSVSPSFNPVDGFGISGEISASYSETTGYSSTQTSGSEVNWETATTTALDNAGTLFLSLSASNSGGATALNVRPTFNVYIGGDLVVTVLPDVPFRQSLAPGESSAPVVPLVGGQPLGVQLSFARLRALQLGAPVRIEVVDILADIQRWRPQDSNWECGSGETCEWTSFQNQILPRTIRLLVDFGYSGDPDANIPFQFAGNPYEYRVYAGSPSTSPGFTLRDILRIADFELTGNSSTPSIEGRPYPSAWVLAEQRVSGVARIEQAWIAAGRPTNLMDVVMPRQSTLFMTSPDPLDPGVALRSASLTPDFLNVRAYALPRGGLPITSARAFVRKGGFEVEVPLQLAESGAYWTTEGLDEPFDVVLGAGTSRVEFTDVSGAVQTNDGPLELPVTFATTCSEVPPGDLQGGDGSGGRAVIFPTSDLDQPVEVYCELGSPLNRYWVRQDPLPNNAGIGTVVVLDDGTTLGAAGRTLFRSTDRGRTWTQVAISGTFWGGLTMAHRPGTNTIVSFGRQSEQVFRASRSTDGGQTWTQLNISASMFPNEVQHVSGSTWIAAGGNNAISATAIWRSTDDGISWTALPSSAVTLRGGAGVAFRDENVGIVSDFGGDNSGTNGRLVRTLDGGQTWTQVYAQRRMTDVTYAGGDTWYALQGNFFDADDATLYKSTQNGASGTWQAVQLTPFGAIYPTEVAFVSPMEGYVADAAGMLKTTDGGATWTLEPLLGNSFVSSLTVYDVNRALITVSAGSSPYVALTTSGGDGMPVPIVAAEPGAPAAHETTVSLAPGVPNPFRDRATLSFTLDAPGDVSLVVFDLLGREVARLADGPAPAGEQTVVFDARGLAPGVYVARLVSGGQMVTQRMTRLR